MYLLAPKRSGGMKDEKKFSSHITTIPHYAYNTYYPSSNTGTTCRFLYAVK